MKLITPPTPQAQINLNAQMILKKIKDFDLNARKQEFDEQVALMGEYFEAETKKANAILDDINNKIKERTLEYAEIKESVEKQIVINEERTIRLDDKENMLTEIEKKLGKMNEEYAINMEELIWKKKRLEEMNERSVAKQKELSSREDALNFQHISFIDSSREITERLQKKEDELLKKEASLKLREAELQLKLETHERDLESFRKDKIKLASQQSILKRQFNLHKNGQ